MKRSKLIRWDKDELPDSMLRLATNRTRAFVHNLQMFDFDLYKFAVSVYLQGVRDTAETAFNNGFIPLGCEFVEIGEGI